MNGGLRPAAPVRMVRRVTESEFRPDRLIVGRAVELDITSRHVLDAGQVLVTGEAGIGKSTLLDALGGRLRDAGFVTVRVAGMPALVAQPLTALAHLTGDPANRAGAELVAFAVERLHGLAPGSSAVMLVDDAHALDPWSLHALVQARSDGGPRLVLASRGASSLPEAVAAVGRHPGMTIDIQRLSVDETAALSSAVLGTKLDTPSLERIHQATDGLPLAIVELLRHALRCGALVDRSGLWRWDPTSLIDPHLASLLGLRVEELPAIDRDVVDILSVVGELPVEVVRTFSPGVDVVALEQQRLVTAAARPGSVTVGHPLLRDASSSMLAPIRRRELLGRLIDGLAEAADADLVRLRIVLAVQVGAVIEPDALREVVTWGRAHGLWKELITVMERAWAECPDPTTGLAYGEALYWTRQMELAESVLGAAEELCTTTSERIALATARARTLDVGLGRAAEADALRAAQLDGLDDPAHRLEVLCAHCEQWVFGGEIGRILDVHAWASDQSSVDGSTGFAAARYRLTQSSVAALGLAGRTVEMVDEYRLHLDLAAGHGSTHPLAREIVDPWWVSCQLVAGHVERVRDVLDERYSAALAIDDGLSRPLWALPRAVERWMACDLVAAEHFAREAMGVPVEVVSIRRMATHYLARILEQSGRFDEALDRARDTAGDDYVGIVHSWSAGVEHRCLVANASFVAPSELALSERRALSAITTAIESAQRVPAAFIAHDLVRAGRAAIVVDALEQLVEVTDAPTVRWIAVHARTAVDRGTGRHVDGGLDRLIEASEEALAAGCVGLAIQLADSAMTLAVDARDASLAASIGALVDRCRVGVTGLPTAGTEHDLAARFGLSAREQEVAHAAIAGLTDQQIATELYISVRTVNAHLRSVYRKLGVAGRRELLLV